MQIFVNNIKCNVHPSETILQVCERLKINIPKFCYHKKLKVAGNCRMCLVEIEGAPKPIASCASPVTENMKIYTNTPFVYKARENVLELLLLNHPLDCKICDQGGECDLQEHSKTYGTDRSRNYHYVRRGGENKFLGPIVKTEMTRCIHCTRCVRFIEQITGKAVLGTLTRGRNTEIGTFVKEFLKNELSGNLVDICPVGALTLRPRAFQYRS
jgi:NADH-quinone oxidoreductase subunit G